jgi:UDPglucose 6-dehydrogenase
VAIIGCGYVGLTTAATLAYIGNRVVCMDTDRERISALAEGHLPFHEPGLGRLLRTVKSEVTFTASYSEAVSRAEVVIIAVGTPPSRNGEADLEHLRSAVESMAAYLGDTCRAVVLKSTVPPGTGAWVRGLLGRLNRAGATAPGRVVPVVSNPEFLREGHALHDSFYPDRIVIGGNEPQALSALEELYQPILDQAFEPPPDLPRPQGLQSVPLVAVRTESAELIKYAANAFLATKISFINEVALLAEQVGADVTDVAEGIGLDSRIGSRFLQAGIGWGGSCLGKDTSALVETARAHGIRLPIVEAARAVNEAQRKRVVETLEVELKGLQDRTVTLLGLAFKPHTDDLRDAPSIDIGVRLVERGAKVKAHDPVAVARARLEFPDVGMDYCDDIIEAVRGSDAVVLVTDWPQYRSLPWSEIRRAVRTPLVYDGRNFLDAGEIVGRGFRYVGVGRGGVEWAGSPDAHAEAAAARDCEPPETPRTYERT